jgi:hypothetical protein
MAKKAKSTKKPRGGRRSRAESMTGSKAAQVEVRSGSLIPDIELSDKDINHHFNAIKRATETKDSAVSALRTAMKKADETHPGLGAELKDQITLERKDSTAELAAELSLKARVLQARGTTIQINIFDTMAGDQLDQVYRRFYKDGKDGKPLDNRYPAGSDLHAQAARAWRHGMAANMNPPLSPEQSDAAVAEDMSEIEANLPAPPIMSAAESSVTHH